MVDSHVAETVVETMLNYMMDVLEKPHPAFGNLPICPFAQRFRLRNSIQFQVHPFQFEDLNSSSNLLEVIQTFKQQQQYEVLFVIHPEPKAMDLDALDRFINALCQQLQPLELIAYGGHPEDDFNISNVYTRREPFINFTVQTPDKLKWGSDILQKTAYYQHWTAENLKLVGFPRS